MEAEGRNRLARVAAPVLILALACALLIIGIHELAKARIEANRQRMTLGIVLDVMPLSHDNDLLGDYIQIKDPGPSGATEPTTVFRARRSGEPIGVVFTPVYARGYNGRVELAIGVSFAGELTGVRVGRHAETPGLGDQVDQSRSNWIRQFDGRSLANTAEQAWAVKSDAGEFDQISGATITPRGVINAVHGVLEYYGRNRDSLYR